MQKEETRKPYTSPKLTKLGDIGAVTDKLKGPKDNGGSGLHDS